MAANLSKTFCTTFRPRATSGRGIVAGLRQLQIVTLRRSAFSKDAAAILSNMGFLNTSLEPPLRELGPLKARLAPPPTRLPRCDLGRREIKALLVVRSSH